MRINILATCLEIWHLPTIKNSFSKTAMANCSPWFTLRPFLVTVNAFYWVNSYMDLSIVTLCGIHYVCVGCEEYCYFSHSLKSGQMLL